MNNWKETTLGEVCSLITDGKHGDCTDKNNSGYFFISAKDIFGGKINYGEARQITRTDFEETDKRTNLQVRDILITNSGTIGRIALVLDNENVRKTTFQKSVAILKPLQDKIRSQYLYYYLLAYNKQIVGTAGGTTQQNLLLGDLRKFEIKIHELDEQKAIAAILSSIDDKIELLRRQNKTLENIAQTIFKEWFIYLKVNSEKLIVNSKTGLTEGWRMGRIKDCGKIVCGKTPPKDIEAYFGGSIPFIKIPDMHNEMFIVKTEDSLTEEGADFQKNKFIPKNSICVSCIATVGLVSITGQKSQTNQQINTIVPAKDEYLEYLYYVLKNMTDDLLAIGSGGSATLNINTGVFSDIEIMLPPDAILKPYHLMAEPLFVKVLSNLSQIQTLSKLRDALLPKLMLGKIRVKGFND